MKFGIRKPSLKKSFKARTTGKMKRKIKKAINPLYGKKGMGFLHNPKKAVYNKIYRKTTIGINDILKGTRKKTKSAAKKTSKPYITNSKINNTTIGVDSSQKADSITPTKNSTGIFRKCVDKFFSWPLKKRIIFVVISAIVFYSIATSKQNENTNITANPTPTPSSVINNTIDDNTQEPTIEVTPVPTPEPTLTPTLEPAASPTTQIAKTPVPEPDNNDSEETVYIGKTGTKYHRYGCSTLKGGGRAISLSQAKKQGRTPCKRCY